MHELAFEFLTTALPKVYLVDTTKIEPPYVHYRRRPEEYILYYVYDGEMYLTEGETDYVLKKGDLIILDPKREHFGRKASTCRYTYVHFMPQTMDLIAEVNPDSQAYKEQLLQLRMSALKSNLHTISQERELLLLPKYYHISNEKLDSILHYNFDRMVESRKEKLEQYALKTSTIFLELLIELSRAYTTHLVYEQEQGVCKTHRTVQRLLHYLNTCYQEDISSDSIEDKFNCNFDYTNRLFRQYTGKTIFVYLTEMRIHQAKHLLTNGYLKIGEVAEQVGIRDPYYFSKVFKRYVGVTPSQYISAEMQPVSKVKTLQSTEE